MIPYTSTPQLCSFNFQFAFDRRVPSSQSLQIATVSAVKSCIRSREPKASDHIVSVTSYKCEENDQVVTSRYSLHKQFNEILVPPKTLRICQRNLVNIGNISKSWHLENCIVQECNNELRVWNEKDHETANIRYKDSFPAARYAGSQEQLHSDIVAHTLTQPQSEYQSFPIATASTTLRF